MAIWEELRTPPKCQFLKYPALKGRVSAGGRMKLKFFRKPPTSELPFSIGAPAMIWQVLFFYLPLAILVVTSVLKFNEFEAFEGLTLDKIAFFLRPLYLKVILSSFVLALGNAILCLLIAYPLAYFLAFTGKRLKNLFLFLLIVPFWTNFLLHVYAWFFVLEKEGFLNNLLRTMGIISEPMNILNTPFCDHDHDGLLLSALHGDAALLLFRKDGFPPRRSFPRPRRDLGPNTAPRDLAADEKGPESGFFSRLYPFFWRVCDPGTHGRGQMDVRRDCCRQLHPRR